jgi:hypothetical protein
MPLQVGEKVQTLLRKRLIRQPPKPPAAGATLTKKLAAERLMKVLSKGPLSFQSVVDDLLQAFMLRETNVKDICCELARAGKIANTWGSGNRKPQDATIIRT